MEDTDGGRIQTIKEFPSPVKKDLKVINPNWGDLADKESNEEHENVDGIDEHNGEEINSAKHVFDTDDNDDKHASSS